MPLHVPGIPTRPNDTVERKRNGPAFKPFPHRITFREVSPPPSLGSSVSSVASSVSSRSVIRHPVRSSASSVSSSVARSAARTSTRCSPPVVSCHRPLAGEASVSSSVSRSVVSRSRPQASEASLSSVSVSSAGFSRSSARSAATPYSRDATRSPPPPRPSAPVPSSQYSTLSRPQRIASTRSGSPAASHSFTVPHYLPRQRPLASRPDAGDAPSRRSTRSPPPARPSAPIPSSQYSTLSRAQRIPSSRSGSPSVHDSYLVTRVIPRQRPARAPSSSSSSRSSRPASPEPAPASRSSSTSTSTSVFERKALATLARLDALEAAAASTSTSTSTRSDSAPSTRSFVDTKRSTADRSTASRSSSKASTSTSTRSDSFPSTRCFVETALATVKRSTADRSAGTRSAPPAARSSSGLSSSTRFSSFPSFGCFVSAARACVNRSSPAPLVVSASSSSSSVSVSSGSSSRSSRSARCQPQPSACSTVTRSQTPVVAPVSVCASAAPCAPSTSDRFNQAGKRLEAALETARHHHRERPQLFSDVEVDSTSTSSRNGFKDVLAQARAETRQNVKSRTVRFGGATVHEVERWIKPGVHTQRDPPSVVGKLSGWSVTPLDEPDKDGEDCKYTTYWGGIQGQLTHGHHAEKPCTRSFCAWNHLAVVRYGLLRLARRDPTLPHAVSSDTLFGEFNRIRAKKRRDGYFYL
ncbi:hypothetical protein AJ79_04833 [Helicocarpus griseus UAMH5409]|uniref:Uncharacterized protein n=1 Tax=Helicocarpus griseus UAMH5409 TaxID=1447875 RepID=A0A2B7XS89_9EURO|nr:hypothetical protein AJ79_04833 [Helicocarpus griseus UAMH5409]